MTDVAAWGVLMSLATDRVVKLQPLGPYAARALEFGDVGKVRRFARPQPTGCI